MEKQPVPLKIAGMGKYLPPRVVPSRELEKRCQLPDGWCARKQGVAERRWADDESIAFMAARAAEDAATKAGMDLKDIDLIINASPSFDKAVPDQGAQIQRELGLGGSGIPCMSVTSACLGFIVALDLAAAFLGAGEYKQILITAAEITTYKKDFSNPNVSTLMGDAAAAAIVIPPGDKKNCGIHAMLMETYSAASDVSSVSRDLAPNTLFDRRLTAKDVGFDYNPEHLQTTAMKYNQKFLAKLWPMSNKERIQLVIPNQASRFVLDMMKFVFPAERIMGVIDRYGNTGAAGYPLALCTAVEEERVKRGDMIMMNGIGAGFSLCGIVLTY
jgi:3-oxoacyl-[acyl-carrier-protein] synthase-3